MGSRTLALARPMVLTVVLTVVLMMMAMIGSDESRAPVLFRARRTDQLVAGKAPPALQRGGALSGRGDGREEV